MTLNNRDGVNWGELILGALYIIVAFISFRSPNTTLSSISVLLGIVAIISGIGDITLRNKLNRYYGDASNFRVVSGLSLIHI